MKSFKEFYIEGKQVGILYHYTSIHRLLQILESNVLKSDLDKGPIVREFVSFTRDKHFHINYRDNISKDCRLVIDGDKLSHHYKLQPYNYFNPRDHIVKPHQGTYDESEERIRIRKLPDIRKYIIKVQILDDELEDCYLNDLVSIRINSIVYPSLKDYLKIIGEYCFVELI
jgi:hypothetical protein